MAVMCALSPFAMSFPIPAFPAIATDFNKPVAEIQYLVSVFLIGLGVAQPIHGVLADRYGRRPVMLMGFGIFIIASIASVLTTSWTALVICRFLQAVGVSAGTVTSRAIINDVQPREEAAISLSYVSIAMGLGPVIAPIFGGILDSTLGWRSIFTGCVAAGVLIWGLAVWRLPETRPAQTQSRNVLADYKRLLSNPHFIGYTLLFGFGQGVFFAFLPVAPDFFENVLFKSTTVFVACWIILSLSFMAGSLMGTRLTRLYGMDKAILLASFWLIMAAAVMVVSYALYPLNPYVITAGIGVAMLGTGLICPLALAGSISTEPQSAATAAGLSSSLGLVLGGLFTVVSGMVYQGTLWPFLILSTVAIIGSFGAMGLTRIRRTQDGVKA